MSLKRNFTSILSWTVASQLVALVSIPILGRLFTPDAFGILALYSSIVAIYVSMFTLRFEWQIPNSKSQRVAGALAVGAVLLCAGLTIVVSAVSYFLEIYNWLLPKHEGVEYGVAFILAIALGVLIQVVESTATSFRVLSGDLTRLGRSRFLRQVFVSAFCVALFFLSPDHYGLIVATLAGSGVAVIYLSQGAGLKSAFELAIHNTQRLVRVLGRAAGRSAVSTVVSVNNTFSFEFVPIALIAFYSPEVAGFFFMAKRFLSAPASLISSSMSSSFWAYSAEQFKKDRYVLYANYLRLTRKLLLVSLPFVLAAGVLSQLMPWIMGETWREISVVMLATIPMALGDLLFSGLGHLIVLRKHHYQIVADLTRLVLMIFSVWISARFEFDGTTAILLMSLSSFVGHVTFMLAHLYAYHQIGVRHSRST